MWNARVCYWPWNIKINPKEAYCHYITDFFKNAGVDGLMHDDIHFVPGWFYCAWKYCREKFKKKFGYDLPAGKKHTAWEVIYGKEEQEKGL